MTDHGTIPTLHDIPGARPRERRSGARAFRWLLGITVLAGVGYVVQSRWDDIKDDPILWLQTETLALLDGAERQVASAMPAQSDRSVADLSARLDRLEARFSSVPASSAVTPPELRDANEVSQTQTDSALAELSARLARLESGVAQQNPQAGNSAAETGADKPSSFASSGIAAQMESVEARLAMIEGTLVRATGGAQVAELQERLDRVEAEREGEALHRAGVVLALTALERAVGAAHPFKAQLDSVEILAAGDLNLDALRPFAEASPPAVAMLAASFPVAARNALEAERVAAAGNGLFGRLWLNMTGLVRVRRIGEATGDTSEDRLTRAESGLARADLAGTIAEVRGLEGAARMAMTPWLRDAENRVALDRAVDGIETRIISALAGPLRPAAPISDSDEPNGDADARGPSPIP